MKNLRKTLSLVLAFLMIAALFTACGGKTEPQQSAAPGSAASTPGGTASAPGSTASAPGTANTPAQPTETAAPPPADAVFAEHLEYIHSDAVAVLNANSPAGSGSTHNNLCRMVYDSLYYNNPDGTSVPMLATSCDTSDFETWTFHLRDDVYFHNGEKFTADDVLFTWEKAMENPGCSAHVQLNYIVDAKVIDDYTIEFKTDGPYSNLLYNLGHIGSGIINRKAVEADEVEGYYIGTGAWKIKEFSPSDKIELERNDEYWGEIPKTKTMTWRLVPEASSRAVMLQNGSAQLGGVASADVSMFEDSDDFRVNRVVVDNSMSLQFNLNDPICGDLNFRKAVLYAIDREELAIFAMGKLAEPYTSGTIWGYSMPYKNEDIEAPAQDVKKAKEFLDQSCYNGEEIEIAIMGSSAKLAEAFQEQMSAIGVKIKINQMDVPSFNVYTNVSDNKAQIFCTFCMISQNPVDALRANFYPGVVYNKMSYNNPVVTELLDKSRSIPDDEKDAHYKKLQELVAADVPIIPVYFMASALVSAKGVEGFVTPSTGCYDLRYTYQVIG